VRTLKRNLQHTLPGSPVLPPPDVATHPMRCAPGDPGGPILPPDALSPG